MSLSLQDRDWLEHQFRWIEKQLIAIRSALPPKEEGIKTDRPADAGETKW